MSRLPASGLDARASNDFRNGMRRFLLNALADVLDTLNLRYRGRELRFVQQRVSPTRGQQ